MIPDPGISNFRVWRLMASTIPDGSISRAALDEVAVEEVMEVLVGGHPFHDRVSLGIGECLARVVMGDPGGQLLERQVGEGVGDGAGLGGDPPGHLGHPGPLQSTGVDVPRHHEVVPDHDGVPTLFGRPPAGPVAPHTVATEEVVDGGEVVREVVLGQDVDEQGAGHSVGQGLGLARLRGRPPFDDLMGKPLLGHAQVAFDEPFGGRPKFGEQRYVVHVTGPFPWVGGAAPGRLVAMLRGPAVG